MKSKTVWKQDIDCDGVIYHTSITKPTEDFTKKWQIALHVKVNGLVLHDYRTHFIEGSGQYDGEVLNEQVTFIFGRLVSHLPKLTEKHMEWYRKMLEEYFKFERFDFD